MQKGDVYSFKKRHTSGASHGHVTAVSGKNVSVRLGHLGIDGDEFLPKTFTPKGGGSPVREATVTASELGSEPVFNQEMKEFTKEYNKNMATKQDTQDGDLTYEMDDQPQAEAAKPKETAEERKARIRREADEKKDKIAKDAAEKQKQIDVAEKAKEDARKKKEADKANAIAQKRTDTLKPLLEGTGLKEKEAAERFSDGAVSKFSELSDEQVKVAKDALKAIAKNAGKLAKAIEGTDKKEKDIVAEFGAVGATKFSDLKPEEIENAITAIATWKKEQKAALTLRLTDEEKKELAVCERQIEKYLPSYQTAVMQVGGPLAIINAKRLYKETHSKFDDYVMERFNLSKPHAYSFIAAGAAFHALTEGSFVDVKNLPSITAAEAIHRGVKQLAATAGVENDAEFDATVAQMTRNIYQLAEQNAPKDKDGHAIFAPGYVKSVFSVLSEVAATGAVEVDGKQVPISLAAASMDEMITDETKERTLRAKAWLADEFAKRAETNKANTVRIESTVLDSTKGNGQKIPEGITPRITTICTIHSRVDIAATSDTDIELACGCVFLSTPEGYTFERNDKEGVKVKA